MRNYTKAIVLGATLLAASAAISQDANMTIVENGQSATNFTALVAAANAAGLTETLMGPGPYTVFAPSNEAFAVADSAMLAELMLPENIEHLANLLKAHIIPGMYTSADLEKAIGAGVNVDAADNILKVVDGVIESESLAGTASHIFIRLNGDEFDISADQNNMVQAVIVEADFMSSNGVVHVIDKLLSPVAN
jgi:uncharacterized surface protein with fasciclin (FAS1) repeats